MGRDTGVGEARRRHGHLYSLFDYCLTKEEADMELQELHKAGYLGYRTYARNGSYHIWARAKVINKRERRSYG